MVVPLIKNKYIMKQIKKYINSKLVKLNLKPIKVVILPTGLICLHFVNGTIKVI